MSDVRCLNQTVPKLLGKNEIDVQRDFLKFMGKIEFKFEKLIIWQKAMDFGEDIFDVTIGFPKEEQYSLTAQLRRAVDSIALNIAEGSTGQTNPEFRKFVGYGIRSLAEVVTCLHKANRRKYISEEKFNIQYAEAFHLMNMMASFRSKIQ